MLSSIFGFLPRNAKIHNGKVKFSNKKEFGRATLFSKSKSPLTKNFFSNIIVSTDDKKILNSKKKYSKFIFLKRPKYLSLNKTKSYQVIRYVYKWYLEKYENIDGIFIFQPTSPLRTKLTINKIIYLFKKNKMKRSVVSVSPISEHPEWMLKIKKNCRRWK